MGALALVLGVCGAAVWLLRRLPVAGAAPVRGGVPLRVLQRATVGPRQGIALVQVGPRVLVLGSAEDGLSLLTELDGEARDAALRAAPAAPAAVSPFAGLAALVTAAPRRRRRRTAFPALFSLALALAALAPRAADAITVPPPAKGPVANPAAPVQTPPPAIHVAPPPLPQVDLRIGEGKDQLRLSGAVGIVVFLGALTLIPMLFLLMTSFTRILIVLHFLRSALGTQTTPPSQLLVALAVLLTGVVMNPVLDEANRTALQPYFQGRITQEQAYGQALQPFRSFMLNNVRDQDLTLFADLAKIGPVDDESQLPTLVIVSAFVTSELRTAFQMGFVLYLPFVVVDVVVSSVLMSLGMFMLPPTMISMPLKLLLFVLGDGWTLVVQNLVASFR
jgi:flagellar biosynthetic protein FliP